MTVQIACIGEPLAEISQGNSGLGVGFGGDTLNTAIYCARLAQGHDIAVHYVSAVGQDTLSQGAVDLLAREGVRTDHVTRDPARQIGIYAIQNDAAGERSFHYWRDQSAARQMFAEDNASHLAAIEGCDLAYLSGISIAILTQPARDRLWLALQARRAAGMRVAFDSNYRPNLWDSAGVARREIARFWQITDIALPSHEDEQVLFGQADPQAIAARLVDGGAHSGAVKCGADGPIALSGPQAGPYLQAEKVVDTTGAGDSFNGAYLAAIARGEPQESALQLAHNLALQVVGQRGAIIDLAPAVRRMGSVIRLKPEHLDEYKRLHADVWSGVLARLRASNITNYSIYLKQPEHLMFGYFEYRGTDFAADDAAIAADPTTQEWWALCGPMQDPFETRKSGEWWAEMEEVFHLD
ncbi:2-dehydro-3-deoxygluconokinase [Monaibacterium marinum]|uniref:2-dehydro-3-deoxygluconokinase n=1 Tax=Pontivivens marinum TaxID=1690039 RepID=A0A2C9CU94_9RHOB|nr:PfkB family carbohydrate kinase [Monaibacterium marinum]SOH94936.1 2-dehydro-3-deoxygluconokinase [Monaibacterium marinum]